MTTPGICFAILGIGGRKIEEAKGAGGGEGRAACMLFIICKQSVDKVSFYTSLKKDTAGWNLLYYILKLTRIHGPPPPDSNHSYKIVQATPAKCNPLYLAQQDVSRSIISNDSARVPTHLLQGNLYYEYNVYIAAVPNGLCKFP